MKVLHLVKTSVGAAWALRQMRELVRLGVEVHAAVPAGGPLLPRYAEVGVSVHEDNFDLPVRRPREAVARMRRLRRLVDRVAPDLIHSHFVGTTLTMRLALGRSHPVPRVFQVPGPLHLEHSLFRSADLATAGEADYWMGSCRWTCDRYARSGIDRDRIFLSYYGLDLEDFEAARPGQLRRELGVAPQKKIVGMIAYMYAPKRYLGQRRGLKGHEDLIDAMALCRREDPHVLCVMVGGAWDGATSYEQRVKAYAREKCPDGVVFLGPRKDVPALYPDVDVAVHPSHSENVGGAVESLLLGRPTITTNVGGFPDLVREGETGWLVPPRDPKRLAAAILDALRGPQRAAEMALRGRELARQMFDVRACARDVLAAYHKIVRDAEVTAVTVQPAAVLGRA